MTLTLLTVHAIMVAIIEDQAPEIFKLKQKNSTQFKCSDNFVQKFLHNVLRWSKHCTTKAAQKMPPNLNKIITTAFLREACIIRDYGVPAGLRVHTDQTQLVCQQGTKTTWNETGAKQVVTVGQEGGEERNTHSLLYHQCQQVAYCFLCKLFTVEKL